LVLGEFKRANQEGVRRKEEGGTLVLTLEKKMNTGAGRERI
jgi:hypothetical protein